MINSREEDRSIDLSLSLSLSLTKFLEEEARKGSSAASIAEDIMMHTRITLPK